MAARLKQSTRVAGSVVAPGAVYDAPTEEQNLIASGAASPVAYQAAGISIFGPDTSYTAPTIVAGAGVTVNSHNPVQVGDETWYEVNATGISGTSNNFEIQWTGLAPFSADCMAAEWQVTSGVAASVTYFMGTAGYVQFVTYGNALPAYSTTQPFNHRGLNGMVVYESQWSKTGFTGATTRMACVQAKVRVVVANGSSVTFRLRSFRAGVKRGKGRVAVVFDDGYQSIVRLGLPICSAYGVPVTMSVMRDTIGSGGEFASLWEAQRARAMGVEFVAHGAQAMYGSGLTTDAQRRADIQQNLAFLQSNRLAEGNALKCYVWPNGVYCDSGDTGNPFMLNVLQDMGIQVARSAATSALMVQLSMLSTLCQQRLLMPVVGHAYAGAAATADDATETTNISTIVSRIQAAAAQRADVFVMLHKVVGRGATTGGSGTIEIETDRLDTLMAAIRTEVDNGTLEAVHMSDFVD